MSVRHRTDAAGHLGRGARLGLALEATLGVIGDLPTMLRSRAGSTQVRRTLSTDRVPPDSALAHSMTSVAQAAYPFALMQHSLRTWRWADLLGQLHGIVYDDELLYVACVLHDLALTDAHQPDQHAACFAVDGGRTARRLVLADGADERFADELARAIALHMDLRVELESGVEAHLLHAGAHLDVVGRRLAELPAPAVAEVVARHPRHGFAELFAELMRRESQLRPQSRAAVLWRVGMRVPISRNPLDRISSGAHA